MTDKEIVQKKRIRTRSVWDWLFETTLGNTFKFIGWSLMAVFVSVIIEWVGMLYLWGPNHSRQVLEQEIAYLSEFNRNLLTGWYPADIGRWLLEKTDAVISFLHLRELSVVAAEGIRHSVGMVLSYGIESFINTVFIFAVRLSICISAMAGLLLVAIVALIDGLVERDIRRDCGGIESAIIFHRAKRSIKPLTFLSIGGYLTAPVSLNPTYVFLPIMALIGFAIYTAAKSFKKFL